MDIAALRFHQVVKRYGGTRVLEGIDLTIGAGECVGLVGVNGAGKTSLLKCLLDFVAVDGGSIDIFGHSHRQPASRKPLAFLPEHFTPPYYMTGTQFLQYMFKLQSLPYEASTVDTMLAALDFDPAAMHSAVRTHSKGMTQKLGLAACLLSRKQALVLDEPMSGLDPKARSLLKQQLRATKAAGGTVFFSSHALADIEELCDRMAILHDGKLQFTGSPDACRKAYGADSLEQAFMRCVH